MILFTGVQSLLAKRFCIGRAPRLQGLKVEGLGVGNALFPAGKQDADPLEGDGSHGGMMPFTPGALGFITGFRPGAEADGSGPKLVEGLAQEFRTCESAPAR
jgi:hypothetical protein